MNQQFVPEEIIREILSYSTNIHARLVCKLFCKSHDEVMQERMEYLYPRWLNPSFEYGYLLASELRMMYLEFFCRKIIPSRNIAIDILDSIFDHRKYERLKYICETARLTNYIKFNSVLGMWTTPITWIEGFKVLLDVYRDSITKDDIFEIMQQVLKHYDRFIYSSIKYEAFAIIDCLIDRGYKPEMKEFLHANPRCLLVGYFDEE